MWIASTGQAFDHVEHAVAIDVEESNAHKNQGRGVHARWGLVYMPSRWQLGSESMNGGAESRNASL